MEVKEITTEQPEMKEMDELAFDSLFDFMGSATDGTGIVDGTLTGNTGIPRYNPKPNGSGQYIFRFRCIPAASNPSGTLFQKYSFWLEDGRGKGFMYDSPKSIGEYCPVTDAYWALHKDNCKDARKNELGEKLSRMKVSPMLIQIKADSEEEDNVGKIFLYNLPVKVYQFILSKTRLTKTEIKAQKKTKECFNLLQAYDVVVTVTNGDDGRVYAFELHDEPTSIMVEGNEQSTDRAAIYEVISQYKIDILKDFGYKEADNLLKQRVKHLLISKFYMPNSFWPDIPFEPVGVEDAHVTTSGIPDMDVDGGNTTVTEGVNIENLSNASVQTGGATQPETAPAQTAPETAPTQTAPETAPTQTAPTTQQTAPPLPPTVAFNVDSIVNEIKQKG